MSFSFSLFYKYSTLKVPGLNALPQIVVEKQMQILPFLVDLEILVVSNLDLVSVDGRGFFGSLRELRELRGLIPHRG